MKIGNGVTGPSPSKGDWGDWGPFSKDLSQKDLLLKGPFWEVST